MWLYKTDGVWRHIILVGKADKVQGLLWVPRYIEYTIQTDVVLGFLYVKERNPDRYENILTLPQT